MSKNKKLILCILSAVALLMVGCVGFMFFQFHNDKKLVQQMADDKVSEEQAIDSIYHHFTSPDLKMVTAEGFVHTIEYESRECMIGEKNIMKDMNVKKLVFDKKGMIVDVKAQYRNEKVFTASFERNEQGQIASITVRTSYTTSDGESYKGLTIRRYTYDSAGYMTSTVVEDRSQEAWQGDFENYTGAYSNFVPGKGYTSHMYKWADDTWNCRDDIRFTKYENDKMGNWVKRMGKIESNLINEFGRELTTEEDVVQKRKITYYPKEEIDFSSYLR